MKNKFGILFVYIFFFSSTFTFTTCTRRTSRTKLNLKPTLEIINWVEGDDYNWKNGNELNGVDFNETVYFIPNDVTVLVLHYYANYPIQFDFKPLSPETYDEARLWSFSSASRIYRSVLNMDDVSTFTYGIIYTIYGMPSHVTGNYICKSVIDSTQQSNMNIFWEGTAPPYLLNTGTTQKVTTHKANGQLVIPCILSVPQDEIELNLLKEMNVTNANNETALDFQYLDTSLGNISYDSFKGFILTFGQNDSVEGRYKCVTNEIEDFVLVEVVSDIIQKKPPHRDILNGKASMKYDSERSMTLTCCSNSNDPPRIAVVPCSGPPSCDLTIPYLEDATFETISSYSSYPDGRCSNYIVYPYAAVQFRCIGEGIDILRRIIFPLERNYPNGTKFNEGYSTWEEIVPENLIRLYAEAPIIFDTENAWLYDYFPDLFNFEFDGKFYAGQNISFRCRMSTYYFADGSIMKVRSNNSTEVIMIKDKEFNIEEYAKDWFWYQSYYSSRASIVLHTAMDSVSCYVPVWNSERWVKKTLKIKVFDPILPKIEGDSDSEYYWTLNSTETQRLECKISGGDPHPELKLMKEGKEIVNSSNILISKTNVSISWTFAHMSYNVHGDYECVATNLAGTYKKSFHIYMEEPHPWTETIIITVVSLALVGGIGFIVLRIMRQRNTVTDLRRRVSIVGTNRDD